MTVEQTLSEKRYFRISIVLLVLFIPLAVLVHSRGGFIEWAQEKLRQPTIAERGEMPGYAGANWKLVALTSFPGELPQTIMLVAEMELEIDDPERFKQAMPCIIAVTDSQKRSWSPTFLTDQILKKTKPDAAEKQHCLNLIQSAEKGTVEIAETFLVPAGAKDFAVSVAMRGEPHQSLLLK
ncbi:hypothetical protein [Ochrobactrum sp. RH2CCR150]|uniref:hypothetical protein n=1 Tax=Ochrobactrum sp. RH2CCR150 TaxID=2587044 RepID=UPI0015FDE56D|nr:hypothetical protein [Ochrobactrum sp. RH2CCR150]